MGLRTKVACCAVVLLIAFVLYDTQFMFRARTSSYEPYLKHLAFTHTKNDGVDGPPQNIDGNHSFQEEPRLGHSPLHFDDLVARCGTAAVFGPLPKVPPLGTSASSTSTPISSAVQQERNLLERRLLVVSGGGIGASYIIEAIENNLPHLGVYANSFHDYDGLKHQPKPQNPMEMI